MTNKKFKKAAMALALTACVAATPLAANAETPENAVPVENKERSEAETPAQQASESANTAPVENQEHKNAEGILEDRETEDKKITTDVEYTDREFTYNEDGTVKSEESSGDIVQKEMDKSTEAASGETAGEGKDSEGSAETPEAGVRAVANIELHPDIRHLCGIKMQQVIEHDLCHFRFLLKYHRQNAYPPPRWPCWAAFPARRGRGSGGQGRGNAGRRGT